MANMFFSDMKIKRSNSPSNGQQADSINSGGVVKKLLQNIRFVSQGHSNNQKQEVIDYKNRLCAPSGIEQDNKILNLQETAKLLQTYQIAAKEYDHSINDLAKVYLLKARYREDRDNFFCSFNVESYTCL